MKALHSYYSTSLFSTPSFWTGAGTVLNLAGNYYTFNGSESADEADTKAIQSDFFMTCQDVWAGFDDFKETLENQID